MPTAQQPALKLAPTVHGMKLHCDRSHEFDGRTYSGAAGFFGFELQNGVRIFKAPGSSTDIFRSRSGKLSAARHIAGSGWFDCTTQFTNSYAVKRIGHRWWRIVRNVLRSHGPRIAWVELSTSTNPYRADISFKDDGAVLVLGQPLLAGNKAEIANDYVVSHSGRFEVTVSDEYGVRDRVRYDAQAKKWHRLVVLNPISMGRQKTGLTCSPTGRLVFEWNGVPPIVIERGVPFEMHLSTVRSLVRLTSDSSLLDWDAQNKRLNEFVHIDGRWWLVAGSPRDEWIFQAVGCPAQGRVGYLQLMPGIVVRGGGVVDILGRSYVNGEAIDVAHPGVRIHRAADVGAWLFVHAATTTVAFFYDVDGEWYQAMPHAVDLPFRSWRHHGPNGNALRWLVSKLEEIASDAPVQSIYRMATLATWRLGFLGIFVAFFTLLFGLVVGVPLGVVSRLVTHVKRAYAASQ